jgi:hypothetical protein
MVPQLLPNLWSAWRGPSSAPPDPAIANMILSGFLNPNPINRVDLGSALPER